MRDPDCHCFSDAPVRMENLTYDLSQALATTVTSSCVLNNVCMDKGFPYVVLTTVTMILRAVAGIRSGDALNCDEEFEKILTTLVSDVRHRDAVLDAMMEKRGRTDQ